ncbi:MAG: protein kinase [Vicinamibacteria bacterium]
MIGKAVAHYRATVRLGAGGMGEVYRATDSRLGREVALKVLRAELTRDADGLARFEREARLLAGLQHSNIAVIHGIEEEDGVRALVMELVEGTSLDVRIRQGALPLSEVLPLARQVAEALEYAHERSIIHRDLKPANVMVTPDGQVKILDFGLAKALGAEPGPGASDTAQTLTVAQSDQTVKGMIMGTAAYMSPEQARGKTVDRRTDVWAFGCVLYEMLAGRRAFAGDTITDTLATVLQGEPDWNGLPPSTPAPLAQLVRRCLDKDSKRRLQAIGEARVMLEELALTSATGRFVSPVETGRLIAPAVAAGRPRRWPLAAAAGAGLVAGALGIGLLGGLRATAVAPAPTWLSLDLAPAEKLAERRPRFTAFALSPDGRTVAFTGVRSGKAALYLRSLGRAEAVAVAGSDDAQNPFFSPDGRFVGFVVGSEVKKASAEAGPVTTLADFASGAADRDGAAGGDVYGASWAEGDRIVVGRFQDGLFEVNASGGAPRRVTKAGTAFAHRFPQVLPGGAILFTRVRTQAGESDVAVLTPKGEERVLVESAADGRYLPTGQLAFFREGVLEAAPFDLGRLALAGTAAPVLEDVMQAVGSGAAARNSGAAQFAWSGTGTLALARGGAQPLSHARPVFVDRRGQATELSLREGYYARPRISPDGGRIAVTHTSEGRRDRTRIWVVDAVRGTMSPLPGEGFSSPVWMPDGQRLIFRGASPAGLYRARADGASEPELLVSTVGNVQPGSVAPDGSVLAYASPGDKGQDIWLLPLAGEPKPRPWLQTSANETSPEISADGRLIAYASDVSGRYEVYVQPFPGPEGARHQVSLAGGQAPRWSRDGRELFFMTDTRPRRLMSAVVAVTPAFSSAAPREVLPASVESSAQAGGYDVSADGRFIMLRDEEAPDPGVSDLQVVLNGLALFSKGSAKQ